MLCTVPKMYIVLVSVHISLVLLGYFDEITIMYFSENTYFIILLLIERGHTEKAQLLLKCCMLLSGTLL